MSDIGNTKDLRRLAVHLHGKLDMTLDPTFYDIHRWIIEFQDMTPIKRSDVPDSYVAVNSIRKWINKGGES